jgi:hypothetical protein
MGQNFLFIAITDFFLSFLVWFAHLHRMQPAQPEHRSALKQELSSVSPFVTRGISRIRLENR